MSQIYKVFYNKRCLILVDDINLIKLRSGDKYYEYSNPTDLIMAVHVFESDNNTNDYFVFVKDKIEEALKIVKSIYKNIDAAGGIIRNENNKLLFIYRFNKWDLPKGHVEEGEKYSETAVREVIEETGVKNIVLKESLGSTYHVYSIDNQMCIKETHWYEMECYDSENLKPQVSEAIVDARWIDINDINIILNNTYPSIRDLVKNYLNIK